MLAVVRLALPIPEAVQGWAFFQEKSEISPISRVCAAWGWGAEPRLESMGAVAFFFCHFKSGDSLQ